MNAMTEPKSLAVIGNQRMTPSEAFVETLVAQGVKDVFGIVGSAYMDAHDLFPLAGLRFISVAHEQNAAHMADGYARVTGKHGVCIAQNGPGITNLVTGVASAYLNHTPMVVLTPAVLSSAIGTRAFQEIDQIRLLAPVTTWQMQGGLVSFNTLLGGFHFLLVSLLAGFICSWSFFRKHNIWGAVLPSGIVVVVTVAVIPVLAQRLLLYLYLFTVCLLMARLFVLEREHNWNQRSIRRHHLESMLPQAFGFALVIVMIASLLPTPSTKIASVAPIWAGFTAPARAIGGQSGGDAQEVPVEDPIIPHVFGHTNPFEGSITLEEEPVLLVAAPFPVYLRATAAGVRPASDADWDTEYNDLILNVKVVDSLEEAMEHIAGHGSQHSEAIVTKDYAKALRFTREVDASAVFVNASTRLNDGFELGLGAEIGISTTRIHARGPMGLEELTSTKFIVLGNGQVRQ